MRSMTLREDRNSCDLVGSSAGLTALAEAGAPPDCTPGSEEELPGPSKWDVELEAPPLLLPLAEARARLDSPEPLPDFFSFWAM